MVAVGKGDTMVMEGGIIGAFTVRLSCAELEPPAFVAVTANVKTPAALGVPPRTPVEEPSVSPAGSVEPLATVKVMGVVPVAVRVFEYPVPTVAVGKGDTVVTERAIAGAFTFGDSLGDASGSL
jgi:hypothetical protein